MHGMSLPQIKTNFSSSRSGVLPPRLHLPKPLGLPGGQQHASKPAFTSISSQQRLQPAAATAQKGFGSAKTAVTADKKQQALLSAPCGCGSGAAYTACCSRYHGVTAAGCKPLGAPPAPTPEALLRARFTAYKLAGGASGSNTYVDYLVMTTHKENREYTGSPNSYASSVKKTAKGAEFLDLSIEGQEPGADASTEHFINFTVRYKQKGKNGQLTKTVEQVTERSHFRKDAPAAASIVALAGPEAQQQQPRWYYYRQVDQR